MNHDVRMRGGLLNATPFTVAFSCWMATAARRAAGWVTCIFVYLFSPLAPAQTPTNSRCAPTDYHCYVKLYDQESRGHVFVTAYELLLLDPDRRPLAERLSHVSGQAAPEAVADLVWKLTLTECTRPGDKTPSYFLAQRDKAAFSPEDKWELFEEKGSLKISDPGPLSEADRLNGVQWRGTTFVKVSTLRQFNFTQRHHGDWSDWADTSRIDNLAPLIGTTEVFKLEKRNNQWILDGKTPGEFIASRARTKLSCATATATDPFASLDRPPLATSPALDPFTDERVVAKQLEEAAATTARAENADALRVSSLHAAAVTVTPAEFDARLAEAVTKRAGSPGVDSAQYGAAMKMVGDIVRLCSSMSETDYAGSLDQLGHPHLLNYKGGAYKDCTPTAGILGKGVPGAQKSGLFISHDLGKTWNGSGWGDIKFHMDVFLLPSSESAAASSMLVSEQLGRYIILAADVKNVAQTAAAKFVCSGTRAERASFIDGPKFVSINTPTKITRLKPSAADGATALVELEGMPGSFRVRKDQARESCIQ